MAASAHRAWLVQIFDVALLATDMLLAGGKGQNVGALRPSRSTVSPDQAAGHLPDEFISEWRRSRHKGRRKERGRSEGLAFADDDIRAPRSPGGLRMPREIASDDR